MNEWIWLIDFSNDDIRIVLADRDTIGGIAHYLGTAAIDLSARSWPWWIGLSPNGSRNLATAIIGAGEALMAVAERHTTHLKAIPVEGDLATFVNSLEGP